MRIEGLAHYSKELFIRSLLYTIPYVIIVIPSTRNGEEATDVFIDDISSE